MCCLRCFTRAGSCALFDDLGTSLDGRKQHLHICTLIEGSAGCKNLSLPILLRLVLRLSP